MILRVIAFALCFLAASCASAPDLTHEIRQIDAYSIRVRRPMGVSADPRAGPGGIDFKSDPLPDGRLDCVKLDELTRNLNLREVSQCLHQLQNLTDQKGRFEIVFELMLHPQPEFVIVQDEDRPNCLNQVLPKLPVPREMIYVAENPEQKTRWCYASRLPVEKGEVMGITLSKKAQSLVLQFPLVRVPENDSELKRMLSAWILTPFFYIEREGALGGKVLTDQLCRACFGEEDPFKPKAKSLLQDSTKNLWP